MVDWFLFFLEKVRPQVPVNYQKRRQVLTTLRQGAISKIINIFISKTTWLLLRKFVHFKIIFLSSKPWVTKFSATKTSKKTPIIKKETRSKKYNKLRFNFRDLLIFWLLFRKNLRKKFYHDKKGNVCCCISTDPRKAPKFKKGVKSKKVSKILIDDKDYDNDVEMDDMDYDSSGDFRWLSIWRRKFTVGSAINSFSKIKRKLSKN